MRVAGKPSPELREIYREAAAKHPDPAIRALVTEPKQRAGSTERGAEPLHHCPKCGRTNFTAKGLKAHKCVTPWREPGQATCACGLICTSVDSLRKHMAECDKANPRVVIGPGMFTRGVVAELGEGARLSESRVQPTLAAQRAALPTPPNFPAARAAQNNQEPSPIHMSKTEVPNPWKKRKVVELPLAELTIHPAIADDPRLAPKDPRYLAMQAAWDEQGGCPPIYATAGGQIVDGRHRYWWLQKTEAEEAPVIEVTEDEVPTVILGALAGRNHTTKGQRAYLAVPKLDAAFKAAQDRRVAILNSGGKAKLPVIPTPDDLAERLGVGRELLYQAKRLHEVFAEGKEGKALRKEWEPKILDGEEPLGLGAALQGIGGQRSTKGAPKKPARNSALRNFIVGWKNLSKPAAHWEKWDDETRELAVDGLRDAVAKLPEPVLGAVVAAVRVARKERAKAATETAGGER